MHSKFNDIELIHGDLVEKFNKLDERVVHLETTGPKNYTDMAEKITKATEIISNVNFEMRALQMETSALADEFAISSLVGRPGEKLNDITNKLLHLLKISSSKLCVKIVKRLGKANPDRQQESNHRHRDILIKLDSKEFVDVVMQEVEKKRKISSNILVPDHGSSLYSIKLHRRHAPALYKFRQNIIMEFPNL